MQPASPQPGQSGTSPTQGQGSKIKYPTRLGALMLLFFGANVPIILLVLHVISTDASNILLPLVVNALTILLWRLPPDKFDEWLQDRLDSLSIILPRPLRFFVIRLLYRDDFAISYLPADVKWANWIAWHLMNIGYTVTSLSSWNGEAYIDYEMKVAFKKAKHVFTILSPDYLKILKSNSNQHNAGKDWYRYFLKHHRLGKQGIPAYVSTVDTTLLPPGPNLTIVGTEDALNRLKRAVPGKPKKGPSLVQDPLNPPPFPGQKLSALPVHWYDGEHFIGRDAFRVELRELLRADSPGSSWPVAITGLDGMGKTRMAYEYARHYKEDYHSTLWVDGSSPDTWKEGIKAICTTFGIMNVFKSPEEILSGWLQSETAPWLLIIDDCSIETLALIHQFVPAQRIEYGHILLTSHVQQIHAKIARSKELSPLASSDAQLFLLRQSRVIGAEQESKDASQNDRDMAEAICEKDLGKLPIAIQQAGAYAFVAYPPENRLSWLRRDFGKTQQRPVILNYSPSYQQVNRTTIATSWLLAFKSLERNPATRDSISLLELCAYLTSDETETIPEEILLKALSLDQSFSHIVSQAGGLYKVIEPLQAYSLVSWFNESGPSALAGSSSVKSQNKPAGRLYMHRLLGTVIRDGLHKQKPRAKKSTARANQQNVTSQVPSWVEYAIKATSDVFPYVAFENWPACQRYRPTALTCIKLISDARIVSLEAVRLLYLTANYLQEMGEYARAQPLMVKALRMRKQVPASGFPNLATCKYGVAELYRAQGRYNLAIKFYQSAHNYFKNQVPGGSLADPRDADEALILNGWGRALEDTDKSDSLDKAREKYNAALKIRLQQKNLDYAVCLSNLAGLDLKSANYKEALQHYQEVGKILEGLNVSGGHPYYCHHLASMAAYYAMNRKYKEAIIHYTWAIKEGQSSLGANHIQIAIRYASQAECYRAIREPDEARKCYERAREIYNQYSLQYPQGSRQKRRHPSNNLMVKSYMLFLREIKEEVELDLVWQDYKG